MIDLAARGTKGWAARELVTGFDNSWSLIDGVDGQVVVRDQQGRAALQGGRGRARHPRQRLGRGRARDRTADRAGLDRRRAADRVVPPGRQLGGADLRSRGQGAGADPAGGHRQRGRVHGQAGRSRDVLQLHQLQPPGDGLPARYRERRNLGVRRARAQARSRSHCRRAAVLPVEGRHAGAGVHRAAQGRDRAGADAALRLRRVRRLADAGVLGEPHGVGRGGRGVRAGQPPRRRRVRQGVARRRAAQQQAERVRRFHRGGRVPQGRGDRGARRGWRSRAARTAGCWSARWSTSGPTCSRREMRKWA